MSEDNRKIDAEVAAKVMLLPPELISIDGSFIHQGILVREIDYYSTNIGAAFEVVEKMRERGYCICIDNDDGWKVIFSAPLQNDVLAHDVSLPLAICRAALAAVKEKP